jgi:hypothetical protein
VRVAPFPPTPTHPAHGPLMAFTRAHAQLRASRKNSRCPRFRFSTLTTRTLSACCSHCRHAHFVAFAASSREFTSSGCSRRSRSAATSRFCRGCLRRQQGAGRPGASLGTVCRGPRSSWRSCQVCKCKRPFASSFLPLYLKRSNRASESVKKTY